MNFPSNQTTLTSNDEPTVLAEAEITGGQLHTIANGNGITIPIGDLFGIRLILMNSFKVPNGKYVVNKFMLQIITKGIEDPIRKAEHAVKTRVETVKEVVYKEKPKEKLMNATHVQEEVKTSTLFEVEE
jgi:hypothetical protein